MQIRVTGNMVEVAVMGKTKAALVKALGDALKFVQDGVAIEFPKPKKRKAPVKKKKTETPKLVDPITGPDDVTRFDS